MSTTDNRNSGTQVVYSEDREWTPVGPLDENGKGIFVSVLYGDLDGTGPTSMLMKYSGGVTAPPHLHSGDYYAVVVSGKFRHYLRSEDEYEVLTAGDYWWQQGAVVHGDSCVGPEDGVTHLFLPNGFDVEFAEPHE